MSNSTNSDWVPKLIDLLKTEDFDERTPKWVFSMRDIFEEATGIRFEGQGKYTITNKKKYARI